MSINDGKSLLIIAGESSGDLHGAALVKNLLQLDPELKIYGIGGDKMQKAGMQLIYHINKMAFLGFLEVLEHLPFIKKVQRELIAFVKEKNIQDIVLIDYPGFNLNIAKLISTLILLIVLSENVFSQNEKIIVNKDYLITTQKFNFNINDTIVKTYICLRPNGIIDFNKNPQDTSKMVFGRSIQNGDSIINLQEKYVEKSKDTIFLKSYFPPLLTHDSSLLNYSVYPFDSSNLYYYEMKYSTILSNFVII